MEKNFNVRLWQRGFPSGFPLYPTLFNVYTHDIPISHNPNCRKALDDSTAMDTNISPGLITHVLQREIDNSEDWYDT